MATFPPYSGLEASIQQLPYLLTQAFGEMTVITEGQAALNSGTVQKLRFSMTSRTSFEQFLQQEATIEPPSLKFDRLTKEWRKKTRYSSSLMRNAMQPEYWNLIKMDKAALPFIFKEMMGSRWADWLFALRVITNETLGTPESNLDEVREAWLNWGRANGYLAA